MRAEDLAQRMTATRDMRAENITGRAIFSECGRYRYTLERAWSSLPRYVMWIMMHPGAADASKNDATIRRCIRYAKTWGYTGILVGNLYAWRTTSPAELYQAGGVDEAIGPENERSLIALMRRASLLVCAWGDGSPSPVARKRVLNMLLERRGPEFLLPYILRLNLTGEPSHPLRTPKALQPVFWYPKS